MHLNCFLLPVSWMFPAAHFAELHHLLETIFLSLPDICGKKILRVRGCKLLWFGEISS